MPDSIELLRRLVDDGWGVDLHSHSRHSDGAWTPTELVRDGLIQGVRVMALTDHDSVAGQAEMRAAGAEAGMAIVTGVEVTTRVGDRSYHLLCYDVDPADEVWATVQANRRGAAADGGAGGAPPLPRPGGGGRLPGDGRAARAGRDLRLRRPRLGGQSAAAASRAGALPRLSRSSARARPRADPRLATR